MNVAKKYKIHPWFLICVGVKETWLWKKLKTANNIWNVWNTDSWRVRYFNTPEEWIEAIWKAFNNGYLWKINQVKDLTRCYDKTKAPVYATSPDDLPNLLWCTQAIVWAEIPPTWNFRLK